MNEACIWPRSSFLPPVDMIMTCFCLHTTSGSAQFLFHIQFTTFKWMCGIQPLSLCYSSQRHV